MRFLALLGLPILLMGSLAAHAEDRRPRVAIIDSGVARTPELGDSLVSEYDMAASPARAAFQPRYDHGTMVATILKRAAPAPVEIISYRVDDPRGCPRDANPPCTRNVRTIAAAISHAVEQHVDAINISLAVIDHPTIVAAVREATRQGITVVLAAGNDGRDRPGNLKAARAAYPRGVLVGAVDAAGAPWTGTNRPEAVATGYNYSWQLGVAVPTALADGREAAGTGTSFAAPIETAHRLFPTSAEPERPVVQ